MDQNNSIRDKKEKAIEYTKEHEVSDTILKTVAGAANCKIDFDALKQEGGNSMWSVFEETAKEGEARGEARGIVDTCSDLGLPDEDILKRLLSHFSCVNALTALMDVVYLAYFLYKKVFDKLPIVSDNSLFSNFLPSLGNIS